ncbi:hypothetical protein FS837_002782 [Tulasnella sp. UAMH 9824]|nr:hypothetical protein FS837_002782 [Tulasnella sp. UAMH 9824]
MLRSGPSTPRRTHASGPNGRSPLSGNLTPTTRRSQVNNAPQSPLTPRTPASSIPSSTLNALPPPFSIAGVIPNWLPEHTPLVTTARNERAVAALIASRAADAACYRNDLHKNGISAIDWAWYIKEVTRRKLMYSQVTDIIKGLCAFLELTTDATVFLYCARQERSPNDRTVGRGEVVYLNLAQPQDAVGSALSSDIRDCAQAFGDHRSGSWLTRQNSYDTLARTLSTEAMRNGDAAHRYGDFPLLARFDAESADSVILAMYDLKFPASGASSTRYLTPAARDEGFSHPGIRLGIGSANFSHPNEAPTSGHPLLDGSSDDGDNEGSTPNPPMGLFVGRRASESELCYMDQLHLTELQKAHVRLALWETHPEHWYDELSPFFGSQEQAPVGCTKTDCRLSDLIAEAERQIASIGQEQIDEAEDAAFLLRGLVLDGGEGSALSSVGDVRSEPEQPTDAEGTYGGGRKRERSSSPELERSIFAKSSSGIRKPLRDAQNLPLGATAMPQPPKGGRCQARKGKPGRVTSKQRSLYRKAEAMASMLDPTSLPHSEQGYVRPSSGEGSTDEPAELTDRPFQGPLPAEAYPHAHPRLLALVRAGYHVIETSHGPTLFLDNENRVVGWRMGVVGGPENAQRWEQKTQDLTSALETLANNMASRTARVDGVARGEHAAASWGYASGGGQKRPASHRQTKRERRWWKNFLQHPEYVDASRAILDSWKTWAPDIYEDYLHCHSSIISRDPSLDVIYPDESPEVLPFASLTANLGPCTICHRHRDAKNRASGGICVVKTLGPYDWKRGGHLVLHELGLVVEMRPGDAVFFPSAVISHETIPIGDDERRYSLVWYSAGGLFRWQDAGFRSLTSWGIVDPPGLNRHQSKGKARWNEGWKKYSTISELIARATNANGGT